MCSSTKKKPTAKMLLAFFFVRKKMRQKEFMNDTNVQKKIFCMHLIGLNWGRCTGKMYDVYNVNLIARTCKHSCINMYICYCYDRISFENVYFVVLLVMFIIPWNAFYSIFSFKRRFSSEKKTVQCANFFLDLFCFVCFVCLLNDKIKINRDMNGMTGI